MKVELTQHAVGQGGMMSGLLETDGGRFHWVYDCGSNQKDALKREIAMVAAHGPVDCLFLSHLDSDHLNGIDDLLAQTHVTEVVLPYLNDLDRLIAAAHDAASGALSGGFITFLADVARWFDERGVERLTFINPRSDDDDDDDIAAPDFPKWGGGEVEGPITAKWLGEPRDDPQSPTPLRLFPLRIEAQMLDTTATLTLSDGHILADWLLAPYAHRPSNERLSAFRKAMFGLFGPNYHARLADMLADKSVLDSVKGCYDLIWSDHNLVSMALYAGPFRSDNWQWISVRGLSRFRHTNRDRRVNTVGWLGTGDMHLNVGVRRKRFLSHYQALTSNVNVFGLPHHGSHSNFDPSLLVAMPRLTQCSASAGPNGYGHPHQLVIDSVKSAGAEFIQVSDEGRSTLRWTHKSNAHS